MNNIGKNLILLFLLIASFGIGFFYSKNIYNKEKTAVDPNNTYKAGWDAAKKRIIETTGYEVINDENIPRKSVTGNIKKINGNELNVKINPLDVLSDPSLDNRVIQIDNNTKIVLVVDKKQEQYMTELLSYNESHEVDDPNYFENAPKGYIEKIIDLKELKVDDMVMIEADNDIRIMRSFVAKSIKVTR